MAKGAYNLLPFTERKVKREPNTSYSKVVSLEKGARANSMTVSPLPVKLSDSRELDVHIRLENVGKRFVQLRFPSSQRIEILIKDEKSHLVTQWSEDRAFDMGISYVGINPGERLDYKTTISTRDLTAGRRYTLLGFFPNYDELRVEQTFVPEP